MVNWYFKTILSQEVLTPSTGVMGYLQRLGASDDIIQYITSLDKKTGQFIINEFRKNPYLTLNDLQSIQLPERKNPYSERELREASRHPEEMRNWILVNFRKLRQGKDYYNVIYPGATQYNEYGIFNSKLDQITDWFNNIHPNISSYTPEQAIEASDQWHKMMAVQGEGLYYEPTKPELILYGPEWQNEKANGWTIQEVRSENDLSVEGNRMNHCVGSYCEEVKKGNTRIFSLRDTQNNPHVTIETSPSGQDIIQIMGNSNNIPKKEYKEMIKEWIINKPLSPNMTFEEDDIDELLYSSYPEEVLEGLRNIGHGEYGIPISLGKKDPGDIVEHLIKKEEQKRYPSFGGEFGELPEALVDAAIISDKMDNNVKWANLINVEEYLSKLSEEVNDIIMDNYDSDWVGMPYPQEEDYETTEEFEEAEEKYHEAEQEVMSELFAESIRGKFSIEGFKYIQELREKGEIPNILVG